MEKTDVVDWFRAGAERMTRGARGVADEVPVYAQMSHHSARLLGKSSIEFFSDAETFLRCELAADIFYKICAPTIHYDVYNIESEALGAQLIWSVTEIPAIDSQRPLLTSLDAFARLRPVKIGIAGRMPYVLEINARLMDMGLTPKVRFTGPFTFAANLLGFQELAMAILTEPDRVHGFMRFLTHEILAPWIRCQREHCGANATATGSDALASPPMLSTAIIREFCLKYVQELEQAVGGVRLAGLWGESALPDPVDLLDIKRAGSPNSIQVLDPDASIVGVPFFRKYADEHGLALVAGLDANLVGAGSVADIAARVRTFIEEGGQAGRFVLFMNDIPYATPPENVHAVISTAHEYRADSSNSRYVRREGYPADQRWQTIEEADRAIAEMMRGSHGSRNG